MRHGGHASDAVSCQGKGVLWRKRWLSSMHGIVIRLYRSPSHVQTCENATAQESYVNSVEIICQQDRCTVYRQCTFQNKTGKVGFEPTRVSAPT